MDRRHLLKAGLAWPLAFASGALAKDPIFIADMHFHMFFPPGPNSERLKPLARRMADGKAPRSSPGRWSATSCGCSRRHVA